MELRQLVGLLDEIGALVRAGVPLEQGLKSFADGKHEVAQRLVGRMEQGITLDQALEAEGDAVPEVVRAVVRAGMRSNRLPAALESMSHLGWQVIDIRERLSQALLYPLILFIVAYVLFATLVTQFLERLATTYAHAPLEPSMSLSVALTASSVLRTFWPVPLVLIIVSVYYWLRVSNRRLMGISGPSQFLRFIPGIRGVVRDHQLAIFADLHAAMLDQGVDYADSIQLAAQSSGIPSLIAVAGDAAARVRQGDKPFDMEANRPANFPSYLAWLMQMAHNSSGLVTALERTAESFRRRAEVNVERAKAIIPFYCTAVIGGAILLVYLLSVISPYVQFLSHLTRPIV